MAYENQKTTVKTEISYMGEYMRKYKQTPEGKEKYEAAQKRYAEKVMNDPILRARVKSKAKLYGETRAFAEKRIPGGFPKGFALHHGFGERSDSFLILPTEIHKALHSKFGRKNEDCLWENPEVAEWLSTQGKPFYAFYKGKPIILTFQPDLF